MLSRETAGAALRRLFQREPVADLDMLLRTLDTGSRMSVFRRLKELGYFSSFTHAGRYYTLTDIPQFDEHGLWFHQGVGFSRAGTLKKTVVGQVCRAESGRTHPELEELVRLRVYNTLLDLVREGKIGRERVDRWSLYVDPDSSRAAQQLLRRREQVAAPHKEVDVSPLSEALIIEVLVEALQLSGVAVDSAAVSRRLALRGIRVTVEQVGEVLAQYGVDPQKKTPPRSPPYRP